MLLKGRFAFNHFLDEALLVVCALNLKLAFVKLMRRIFDQLLELGTW